MHPELTEQLIPYGGPFGVFLYLRVMAAAEKEKLLEEIETMIQSLSLLLSTIQSDRSRKPEAVEEYRKQYNEMLNPKKKKNGT